MSVVKFGDVVKEVKSKIDRNNNPYEFYVAGDHMDSEDLHLHRKGSFATDDVGPAFIREFLPGQILYGSRRTYLKKVAVADFSGVTANTTFVLETKNEKVLRQRLIPFIMLSDAFTEWSISKSKGSTNPYVLFSDLAGFEFELPTIEEQDKLVNLLWSMDDVIVSYKDAIAKTDDLVKSQFIEMFGNPYTNPKKWETGKLEDVMVGKASNGFFTKPANYSSDGNVGVICVGDVVNRKYSNVCDLRRATADEKQIQKFKVQYGDMLFCRSSLVKEGIAKASIVPKDSSENVLFECHVIRVKLDLDRVIPEFMQAFTITDYFRVQMMDKSKTATMTTISQKDVISGTIYIPDMDLQKQFVHFAAQSDKSKLSSIGYMF